MSNHVVLTREELEAVLEFEDSGFSFADAILHVFGSDVVRLGILSDNSVEALAQHMADLIHIKTLDVLTEREHWRALAGLSGQAADMIVRKELEDWQNENWPSWGQPLDEPLPDS